MIFYRFLPLAFSASFISGCAGLEFHDRPAEGALTYFDPKPYLLVETSSDCTTKTSVITVPGEARSVALKSGYGTADLSVSLSNGMITSVGQKTDTKIPETVSALAGAVKDVATVSVKSTSDSCRGRSVLYPIVHGRISKKAAVTTTGLYKGEM